MSVKTIAAKVTGVVGIAALAWMYPFLGAVTFTIAYGLVFVLRRRK